MHWSNQYVGIPYKDDGYTRAGCFCWGLVQLVLKEQFGINIPRHDEIDETTAKTRYETVDLANAVPGDVVHMWGIENGRKVPTHVGVIVLPGFVLHTEQGTHSIIESVKSKRSGWRIISVYRPHNNDDNSRKRNAS